MRPIMAPLLLPLGFAIAILCCSSLSSIGESKEQQEDGLSRVWDMVPFFQMKGGLGAYWSFSDGNHGPNSHAAFARGFKPLTIINTLADYPGKQAENIQLALGKLRNPWAKPSFFERIIKRNIADATPTGVFIHDIELPFEQDPGVAWSDKSIRDASGASNFEGFKSAYFKEWASVFWLPAKWAHERYPDNLVGLYGPQPFHRDYHGIAGKTAAQIDGTHINDGLLWEHIDPYVDFYIASIYTFYERPDSIFYMASNVEENFLRTRAQGNKPVFAYVYLRYHDGAHDVAPYLAEAMGILPYFTGANSTLLFAYEPDVKPGEPPGYAQLPVFVDGLRRVSQLSEKIGRGRLEITEPASELWLKKRPLVRLMRIGEKECVVYAINPWQGDGDSSSIDVKCGETTRPLVMNGRHSTLAHIAGEDVTLY